MNVNTNIYVLQHNVVKHTIKKLQLNNKLTLRLTPNLIKPTNHYKSTINEKIISFNKKHANLKQSILNKQDLYNATKTDKK